MSITLQPPTRLTHLANCAGCAAKLSQTLLTDVLRLLGESGPAPSDDLLVDASTLDDAAVYRLRPDLALVQTADFFTPIVDDPYTFGRIAAANALSDVYAMGGRPITALNLLGVPADKLSVDVIAAILRGGADKAREAQCAPVGGHTIRTAEPIYGMSVTGLVHPDRLIVNTAARPGDLLVLTKPLGTGIVTTAMKRDLADPSLATAAIESMCRLNTPAAELAEAELVRAGTDVTGFGLIGHLANICRGSGVAAEVHASAVPALGEKVFDLIDAGCVPGGTRSNLESADAITDWAEVADRLRVLLTDAQTSGPLLLCVAPAKLDNVRRALSRCATLCCETIGQIINRDHRDAMIRVR